MSSLVLVGARSFFYLYAGKKKMGFFASPRPLPPQLPDGSQPPTPLRTPRLLPRLYCRHARQDGE